MNIFLYGYLIIIYFKGSIGLKSKIFSQGWSFGLITPIYKNNDRKLKQYTTGSTKIVMAAHIRYCLCGRYCQASWKIQCLMRGVLKLLRFLIINFIYIKGKYQPKLYTTSHLQDRSAQNNSFCIEWYTAEHTSAAIYQLYITRFRNLLCVRSPIYQPTAAD